MSNSKDYNDILKKIESLRENSSKESDNEIKSLSDVVKNIKNFQHEQYDFIIAEFNSLKREILKKHLKIIELKKQIKKIECLI